MRVITSIFCLLFSLTSAFSQSIPVAFIGTEITLGEGMVNPKMNAYPRQLNNMLGRIYEVKDFSRSNNSLTGDSSIIYDQKYLEEIKDFRPEFIFLELGISDNYESNMFIENYVKLIEILTSEEHYQRFILLKIGGISGLNKVLEKLAYEKNIEILDLNSPLKGGYLTLDNGYLNSLGASKVAKELFEVFVMRSEHGYALSDINDNIYQGERVNFYGYEQINFQLFNWDAKVVVPKKTRIGRPWVWRARFWGHEPQTDVALLQRGYHVVYIDVSNLYGSPVAVDRWNRFYDMLVTGGLALKPALEGMSRGGLIIYNWAAENPEKVACIYADAPVLDTHSWPQGSGVGKGSENDWNNIVDQYKLKNRKNLEAYNDYPLAKVSKIANANIPSLIIAGDSDDVVPSMENAEIFEKNVNAQGGNIKLILKPGIGHHPHSLENPGVIVDFITQNTGAHVNFSEIPQSSGEYRSGAGWPEGVDWWGNHLEISDYLQYFNPDILFIGNSITQGISKGRMSVSYNPGFKVFDEELGNYKWYGAGISGDRTEHILFRINNGQYYKSAAKLIVLTIGVNNFGAATAEEIGAAIVKIVNLIEIKMPDSKILLLGPLPVGIEKNSAHRIIYNTIHELLNNTEWGDFVTYKNIEGAFELASGDLNLDYYSNDGVHLKPEGYRRWIQTIKPEIDNILK